LLTFRILLSLFDIQVNLLMRNQRLMLKKDVSDLEKLLKRL